MATPSVQSIVSQVVRKTEASISSQSWPSFLISAMSIIDSSFPYLAGASKQTVALDVMTALVNQSSMSATEKTLVLDLISDAGPTLISGIVSVSKGLSSINLPVGCLKKLFCCGSSKTAASSSSSAAAKPSSVPIAVTPASPAVNIESPSATPSVTQSSSPSITTTAPSQ